MEGSIVVGKTASENPNKEIILNLDVVQCNTEQVRGRDSLSVSRAKKIKIRQNGKIPTVSEVNNNRLAKQDNDWTRFITVATPNGKKNKSMGKVQSAYSSRALDEKLERARKNAAKEVRANTKSSPTIRKKDSREHA